MKAGVGNNSFIHAEGLVDLIVFFKSPEKNFSRRREKPGLLFRKLVICAGSAYATCARMASKLSNEVRNRWRKSNPADRLRRRTDIKQLIKVKLLFWEVKSTDPETGVTTKDSQRVYSMLADRQSQWQSTLLPAKSWKFKAFR